MPPRCARPPLVPPCSTRGGFPLPLRVGLLPPRLGTQTGKQSNARKVRPSPSFGAPDDSHKTGSTEPRATPLTPASVTGLPPFLPLPSPHLRVRTGCAQSRGPTEMGPLHCAHPPRQWEASRKRGDRTRPPLCAKGGCRATPKGTHYPPLPLFGSRPRSVEIERDAPCPSCPAHARERSTRRRRANGGKRERPRKSERRRRYPSLANAHGNAPPPFTLSPAQRPTRGRHAKWGAPKGSSAPPPLRVSTTPHAVVLTPLSLQG